WGSRSSTTSGLRPMTTTAGLRPMTTTAETTQVRLSQITTPAFRPFWRAASSHKYLRYVCKGGRGSGKSSHIALRIIVDVMRYPVTARCGRRVARTLEESCYEQLLEAIDLLGVRAYWRAMKSPLQLIYLPRGNKIIFRGADDPAKLK